MMIAAACIVSALTHELDTLREMQAAFRRRQAITTFEVQWNAELTVIENHDAVRADRCPRVITCPPQSFAVQGDCVCYRGFRDPFYEKVGSELTDYICYFNGQDSITCRITPAPGRERVAEVHQKNAFDDRQNLTFAPLWMHFCTNHHMGIPLRADQLTLLPEGENINGVPCRVLTGQRRRQTFRIFVAPDLDFAIVRYIEMSEGGILRAYQVDTQYKTLEGHKVPLAWHAQWYSGGMIRQSLKASVQQVALDRKPDRDHLRPTFPTGTKVHDISEGIIYQVADDGSYQLQRRTVRSSRIVRPRPANFRHVNLLPLGIIPDVPN
ncbi:MAG: hypothetical protein NXI04_07905 [Planctomycetaceae bacterium]|nr:hypothetical protein [Planctomycetaceae bacterium]